MSELPILMSPIIDNQPTNVAASFLGQRDFDHYSDQTWQQRSIVNATATGDARMIVGNVNTNTTITGEVKKVKVYQFPEVQVGYSSRIANDDLTIRRWLISTDQKSLYEDIRDRREPETNRWLLEDQGFQHWASFGEESRDEESVTADQNSTTTYQESVATDAESVAEDEASVSAGEEAGAVDGEEVTTGKETVALEWSNFVWLHGGVGCGKTVLCASVIEQIDKRIYYYMTGIRLCYFFFSFQGSDRGDLSALLRSLLSQLSKGIHVPRPIVSLYMRCHQTFPTRSPTLLELQDVTREVFVEVLKTAKVYLVIDALDEVAWGAQREDLLRFMRELPAVASERLRVLVSSRNESDIQDTFCHPDSKWTNIPVSLKDVDKDIEKYINNGMEKHRSLKRQSSATKSLIREKLIQDANGMFRWSALQLSSLRQLRPSTSDAIKTALAELPKDLNETYERMLSGIDEFSRTPAIKALKWLVASKRTLYIEEIAEASSSGLQEVDRNPFEFRDAALEPFNVVEMLQDLVEVQPALPDDVAPELRRHKITLAHFSVQEFLLRDYIKTSSVSAFSFKLDEAHFSVAQDCLAYLYRFNTAPRRFDSIKSRLLGPVLREYAWYNWEKHVLPSTGNESISDPARRKASILYVNFQSQSLWTEEERLTKLTSWLPSGGKERLLNALNIPYFYDGLAGYFEKPTESHDGPHWFGNERPDATKREIALISILPCLDPEDDLRCQLHIVSLEDSPPFKAISYALGPVDDSPIFIGGSRKSVRPHLANIFRDLRLHQEGQRPRFWVDAISLEEWRSSTSSVVVHKDGYYDTDRERIYYTDSRLLVMLSEVFREAQEVVISLGVERPDDEQAIALIHRLVHLSDLAIRSEQDGEYINDSQLYNEIVRLEQDGGWSVLSSILSRTWWQRRWTIQEIVLARSAVLFTGNIAFSFDVIDRFVEAEAIIRKCLVELHGPLGQAYHEVFDSAKWESIKNLSQSRQEYNSSGPIALSTLLWRFRLHNSTYREDVLRCIVPLTWKSGFGAGFEVAGDDANLFTLDLPESIAKAFKDILVSLNSLHVLSLHSAYSLVPETETDDSVPQSWFPALERDASEVQPLVMRMVSNKHPKLYQACGARNITYQFADAYGIRRSTDPDYEAFRQNTDLKLLPSRLSLKGVFITTVARISDAYLTGIRDKAILAFARKLASLAEGWMEEWQQEQSNLDPSSDLDGATNKSRHRSSSSETIWRTLLADQYEPETRLPAQLPHPELPSSLPPRNDEAMEDLLQVPATQRALKYLYGRRLIMTKDGRIGLVPFGAREGDTIVILAGGTVPYVIRGTNKRMVGHFIDIPLWNFIGECYVHGIMDGELVVQRPDGSLPVNFQPVVFEAEMRKIPQSERPPWHEKKEETDCT